HERLGAPADHAADEAGAEDADLLDLDTTIARHCKATGEAEPGNLEDRMRLHVRLLHDAIAKLEGYHDEEGKSEVSRTSARKESVRIRSFGTACGCVAARCLARCLRRGAPGRLRSGGECERRGRGRKAGAECDHQVRQVAQDAEGEQATQG